MYSVFRSIVLSYHSILPDLCITSSRVTSAAAAAAFCALVLRFCTTLFLARTCAVTMQSAHSLVPAWAMARRPTWLSGDASLAFFARFKRAWICSHRNSSDTLDALLAFFARFKRA